MEDRRIMAVRDGRRLPPRNSRGEFRRRRSRRDRGMDYDMGYDMRGGDYGYDMRGDYGDYAGDMARGGRGRGRDMADYEQEDMRRGGYDRAGQDYGMDGHYMHGGRMGAYEPAEFMGYCKGYAGMPEEDYGRGGRVGYGRDYGYDMARGRGRRDYGYYDMAAGDYGDYGEVLSEKELEHWNKKMLGQLDEREKQMFSKEAIMQKIKQTNIPMEGFGEKELYTATLAMYTDYKSTIGMNPDTAIKLGRDFLVDKDAAVRGAEKLAVYYDNVVDPEE